MNRNRKFDPNSKQGKAALASVKPAKIMQGASDTFNSQEEQKGDLLVVQIFDNFKAELDKWFHGDSYRRNDVDKRG